MGRRSESDPLELFQPAVRAWFSETFAYPTRTQAVGWPVIAGGASTLLLAPTGTGKTLTAFLWCLNHLMFTPAPSPAERCRVLYVSPLKALAVDVERNLQGPLAGIARTATRRGDVFVEPRIAVRTGDTPANERARFKREPADILITTPESLYLLLTSNARDSLRSIRTIIVDEIHALVGTKRGAHLALSLERLVARSTGEPQRVGLSATQRPLEEVARFLGGTQAPVSSSGLRPAASHEDSAHGFDGPARELEHEFRAPRRAVQYRPVTIVDAGTRKAVKLTIEVAVQERRDAADRAEHVSVWSAIHPRLLDLIRAHRSTLIFVNSRRLAERLAGALNDLAGEALVRSHHGSLALAQRTEVEGLLKTGALRALVATSSLELGIDMGAIDLVVQIEAPPSVASGLQRIGRAGHQVNGVSEGVIFPKFRGDLVACAAVAKAMHEGAVEPVRYPRNPLDVLAQQIVAMVSMDDWGVGDLFATIRRAAPFAELGYPAYENVLDMLAGRYPSDEFAALKPRLTWDRVRGRLSAREGARRIAVANGGTIPDRGLYGVFLAGRVGDPGSRVGELDEEMVFESRVGDTFVLGASSWRIEEITHDRVLVSPAFGEPGKTPFWKGDRAGRPLELGLAIGRLTRDLLGSSPDAAVERLTRDHDLDEPAARSLLAYLQEQAAAGAVPDTGTVVVERVRDEIGDWRVCVLSPRGGRVHAPWAMAVCAKIREARGFDVEMLWGDDGFVVRLPDTETPPDVRLLVPDPEEAHQLIVRQLGATALFAAKFRENAARSLLLPKRRPGMRAPLWQQRKRAADLLAVASRYGSFPVLLETYRECLRDFFDLPALTATLSDIRSRKIRVVTIDSERPSPFAASLLFSYVASFLYDGDAPLAERRAQALVVDQAQLGELLGDAELRDLLDQGSIETVERQLQRLDAHYHASTADGVNDMLLALGDLALDELRARTVTIDLEEVLADLTGAGRVLVVTVAGEDRYIAVEDAARYRDALGARLPGGLPPSLLGPASEPVANLALRYARTHAPFTLRHFAERFGLSRRAAEDALGRLVGEGRLLEGEFRPGGIEREWTDQSVLRMLRRRSLAKLRKEVEPVGQPMLARFLTEWHGVVSPRPSPDALLDVVEQLQGAPVPASILETDILPARLSAYDSAHLDAALAAGEVAWVGLEPIGDGDGRIALFLADRVQPLLAPAETAGSVESGEPGSREMAIVAWLNTHGASFFAPLHNASGGGYPAETVAALWRLVWSGLITNDTFHALRAFTHAGMPRSRRGMPEIPRARRLVPPSAEGRWSLVLPARAERYLKATRAPSKPSRIEATRWAAAAATQLLTRHGLVNREAAAAENLPGGFSSVYPVLKAMEDAGRVRRGYFVAGLGATQFAVPGALDRLRSMRDTTAGDTSDARGVLLAAADPANPYGAILKWPTTRDQEQARAPSRTVGASVVLVNGSLVAYLARGDRVLSTWMPASEPERSRAGRLIGCSLIERARQGNPPRGMLIEQIDGIQAGAHPIAPFLMDAGFLRGALGLQATSKG